MPHFLCPSHRHFLASNLTQANRYVLKSQQACEDQCGYGHFEQAYIWAGRAFETAELVLELESGWSVHSIMQFSASCIQFYKLSQLLRIDVNPVVTASIQKLEVLSEIHQLHNVVWVQDCLHALRLQQSAHDARHLLHPLTQGQSHVHTVH